MLYTLRAILINPQSGHKRAEMILRIVMKNTEYHQIVTNTGDDESELVLSRSLREVVPSKPKQFSSIL